MLKLIYIFLAYSTLSAFCFAGGNSGVIHFHGEVVIGGCSTNTNVMTQKVSFNCEQQGKPQYRTTVPFDGVYGNHIYGGSFVNTSIRSINGTTNLKLLALQFD